MTQPLKDAVREHVEQRELSEDQLSNLEALMAPEQDNAPEAFSKPKTVMLVLSALAIAVSLVMWQFNQPVKVDPLNAIALEVANNHLKLKPLEVKAREVAQTQAFFTKLNFKLINKSSVVEKQPWSLQGGRYCSIQGYDAAQLRYKDTKHNQTVSVYMAPYKPAVMGTLPKMKEGQSPAKVTVKGVDVWIWVEKDVLLAATPVSN